MASSQRSIDAQRAVAQRFAGAAAAAVGAGGAVAGEALAAGLSGGDAARLVEQPARPRGRGEDRQRNERRRRHRRRAWNGARMAHDRPARTAGPSSLRLCYPARVARRRRPLLALAGLAALLGWPADAGAFPHVVKKGETLAQIAERTYGRVEMEQLLVAANGLDAGGGIPIVAGMRLEVPALGHHRVTAGETWAGLALELLGDERRSDVLALANGSMPWLTPADGQEIVVPYNLRVVATSNDSLLTVAYRYLGERDKAWMLDGYNHRKGEPLHRGDVVLVPLHDLALTAEGKLEAASAGALVRAEGAGKAREAQRRAEVELPQLAAEVRGGRWVDAVSRGNRVLGYGDLARPEVAAVQRALTEAYVALDALGPAETACTAWREADPTATLDPIELSPKILRACVAAAGLAAAPAAPPATARCRWSRRRSAIAAVPRGEPLGPGLRPATAPAGGAGARPEGARR